ncbi:MAG: peptidase domain-containing ABC transporter, partial [Bacteroidia bacterium]
QWNGVVCVCVCVCVRAERDCVLITGLLHLVQQSLVERLQQRIFARAAFEFTFRLTHLPHQTLKEHYPPSLSNRFFDVLNVQKGLPKLLIDFSAALLQLIFGLILLSLYHSFFVSFGVFMLFILVFILILTWNKALQTSLNESKYKYKVADWLEEVIRSVIPFKLTSNDFSMQKTDKLVYNYINYRKKHFSILKLQFLNFTLFKTLITGGLLILGSILVLQNELNLGQFVASELIILIVIAASEKLVTSIEVLFDVLTAVEKMGGITDLEIEKMEGMDFATADNGKGMKIGLQQLGFQYEAVKHPILSDFTLEIPANERVCIAGVSNSGKSTLLKMIASLYPQTQGVLTYNDLPRNNFSLGSLRARMGVVFREDVVFQGSLLENITLGREGLGLAEVQAVIENVLLLPFVQSLPEGLATEMRAEGYGLPSSVIRKILLARAIIHHPRLLLIDHSISDIELDEREQILRYLIQPDHNWTMIIVSNRASVAAKCSRIIVLKDGKVGQDGKWENIIQVEENTHLFF